MPFVPLLIQPFAHAAPSGLVQRRRHERGHSVLADTVELVSVLQRDVVAAYTARRGCDLICDVGDRRAKDRAFHLRSFLVFARAPRRRAAPVFPCGPRRAPAAAAELQAWTTMNTSKITAAIRGRVL